MAIYRNDQVQVSFGAEPGPGGTLDRGTGTGTGAVITLTTAAVPGDRAIAVDTAASLIVGDYLRLGDPASVEEYEVRKVMNIASLVITLDYPLTFNHGTTAGTGGTCTELNSSGVTANTALSDVTFIPGVYQTVEVPDMIPEITPHWFLGTAFKRDFAQAYRGKQAFTGSIPNFILLNGYPLRFPIGSVATTGTDSGAGGSTSSAATDKGDLTLPVTLRDGYADNDYIQIGTGSTAEVRQIASGGGQVGAGNFVLDYPLMIAHASGVTLNEVIAPFTHTIQEENQLDTVSWHVLMRDSGETAANDFIRRYVGGLVGRASISADEAGVLMMSWDSVPFMDMAHNQSFQSNYGSGTTELPKRSQMIQAPIVTFPTTEPYFFSQGVLRFFGIEFARIRNVRISISNNEQPRYYIRGQFGNQRGPAEIQVQRREYRISCTAAMNDSLAATATTRTLFKELLLEGNYSTSSATLQGLAMELDFTKGTNDTMVFSFPNDETPTAGLPNSSNQAGQGVLILSAKHNVGTESPVQVDLEMMVRSMQIVVVDSVATYP